MTTGDVNGESFLHVCEIEILWFLFGFDDLILV